MRLSSALENPYFLAVSKSSVVGLPARIRSISTIFFIFSRKNGLILVSSAISPMEKPTRMASKRHPNRSSVGRVRIIRISLGLVCCCMSVSRDRSAFMNASSRHLPIAITSPVLFIAVVSVRSAPLNLSKGHRGTFTTT